MLALEPAATDCGFGDMAVVLGTNYGCLDTDLSFLRSMEQSGEGSPQLFTYTLPSMAIGEVAIRHAITGPNLCILAGPENPWAALREGMGIIAGNEASCCLCVGADAVSKTTAATLAPEDTGVFNALALLLDTRASAEAHRRPRTASVQLQHGQVCPEKSCGFDDLCQFIASDNSTPDETICLSPPGNPAGTETIVIRREASDNH
jgi:3-oxoacyl-(acyl-carrier-protein) synthase